MEGRCESVEGGGHIVQTLSLIWGGCVGEEGSVDSANYRRGSALSSGSRRRSVTAASPDSVALLTRHAHRDWTAILETDLLARVAVAPRERPGASAPSRALSTSKPLPIAGRPKPAAVRASVRLSL